MTIAIILHSLAGVLWVGGMFFAHQILRPVASALEAPVRLTLWRGVLARFFAVVWVAIVALLFTGFGMVLFGFGGFAHLTLYVNLMMLLGLVMMAMFGHVFFAPWRRYQRAVAGSDWPAAAKQLAQIRTIVGINLILGLLTVAIGSSGRFW